ncbi:uncharacterized protein [Halyomorpha halys]|uniref:uncharacterized protein isoform X1 n=1 Tax=Halyomorpha halys TaxID=286706 RepID=UPI0006D4C776|nr:uncharacterized protein LOC106677169 [Halyomorpha halys]
MSTMSDKTVVDIFKSMDLEPVKNSSALLGAKEYLENYEKSGQKFGRHKHYVGSKSLLHTLPRGAKAELFSNITNVLDKNKDALIALLNLTIYNHDDSTAIIENLCNDCLYYFTNIFVYDEIITTGHLLDFHIQLNEIPILGRLLFPALMLGYSVCLIIHEESHLPFFAFLGDLFKESGCPESTYSLVGTDFPLAEQLLCIKDCSSQQYCPVLIFNDADLDSAVENSLQGAWKYRGKTFYSVTHLFIQEAVYDQVTIRLIEKATQLKEADLFSASIRHELNGPVDVEHCGSIQVFQPSINHANRIFLGWDPRDLLEDKPYDLGIAILPFRTRDEGIALANKSRFGCCASVWTESITTANYVSSRLEVNTIWINSHGIIDPSVPLESQKESKIPINGISLLNYLRDFGKPIKEKDVDSENSDQTSKTSNNQMSKKILDINIKPVHIRKSIHVAVEMARSAYKSLLQFDKTPLLTFLNDLDTVSTFIEEEFGAFNLVEQLKGIYRKSQFGSNSKLLIAKNMNIEWFYEPLGTVWVILSNMYDTAFGDLIKLIYSSLTFGNSVIVSAYSEELQRLVYCAFKLFENARLPEGSLNYLQAKLSEILPDANDFSCNVNARYINKFIFLDKEGSDKFPGFLGQYINVKMENAPDIPFDLYCYMPRVVWIPTI